MCINKNEELLPYYEKARTILNYDPNTGVFTLKKSRGCRKKGDIAGSLPNTGYRIIKSTFSGITKTLKAHRLAWFMQYDELPNVIDHINGVKDDNRINNLRSCSQQENTLNKMAYINNTSRYKGVYWKKQNKKWQAQISFNGKSHYLGLFDCPKEASEVYEEKAKELHGEFYND